MYTTHGHLLRLATPNFRTALAALPRMQAIALAKSVVGLRMAKCVMIEGFLFLKDGAIASLSGFLGDRLSISL